MEQRRHTSLTALSGHSDVDCTSTIDVVCALLTQPCWSTRRSTLGDRAFPLASARAWNLQPVVVCQECTVADDVSSRTEDCTFSVVVWQWSGDRDCTAQYNCCLPAATDCRRFCLTCLILYGSPKMSLTWQCHLNQYTVTYLLPTIKKSMATCWAILEQRVWWRTDRHQNFHSIYRALHRALL